MKFKEGDRVVIVGGTEEHEIPLGTICVVNYVEEGFEYPYDLKDAGTGEHFGDNMVSEDEIEFYQEVA